MGIIGTEILGLAVLDIDRAGTLAVRRRDQQRGYRLIFVTGIIVHFRAELHTFRQVDCLDRSAADIYRHGGGGRFLVDVLTALVGFVVKQIIPGAALGQGEMLEVRGLLRHCADKEVIAEQVLIVQIQKRHLLGICHQHALDDRIGRFVCIDSGAFDGGDNVFAEVVIASECFGGKFVHIFPYDG